VLDVRAEHAGGELGAQREPPAAAVVEGVHLLLDDEVGGLADGPLEHLGELEDGGGDLLDAGALEHARRRRRRGASGAGRRGGGRWCP
jgi:hypothetical protein